VGEEKPEEEPMGEGSENTFTGSDFSKYFAPQMAFYACIRFCPRVLARIAGSDAFESDSGLGQGISLEKPFGIPHSSNV
jgi:hypothetical protein